MKKEGTIKSKSLRATFTPQNLLMLHSYQFEFETPAIESITSSLWWYMYFDQWSLRRNRTPVKFSDIATISSRKFLGVSWNVVSSNLVSSKIPDRNVIKPMQDPISVPKFSHKLCYEK